MSLYPCQDGFPGRALHFSGPPFSTFSLPPPLFFPIPFFERHNPPSKYWGGTEGRKRERKTSEGREDKREKNKNERGNMVMRCQYVSLYICRRRKNEPTIGLVQEREWERLNRQRESMGENIRFAKLFCRFRVSLLSLTPFSLSFSPLFFRSAIDGNLIPFRACVCVRICVCSILCFVASSFNPRFTRLCIWRMYGRVRRGTDIY